MELPRDHCYRIETAALEIELCASLGSPGVLPDLQHDCSAASDAAAKATAKPAALALALALALTESPLRAPMSR